MVQSSRWGLSWGDRAWLLVQIGSYERGELEWEFFVGLEPLNWCCWAIHFKGSLEVFKVKVVR